MFVLRCAFACLLATPTAAGAVAPNVAPSSSLKAADAVIESNELVEFAAASDGHTIAYVTAAPSPEGDAYAVSLWLGDRRNVRPGRRLATLPNSPTTYVHTALAFAPAGNGLAYLSQGEVHLLDPASGRSRSLTQGRLPSGSVPVDFSWSPDGREIALVVTMPRPPEATAGGKELTVAWPHGGGDAGPGRRLAILNLATGEVGLVTGADLDVADISWSPDGRRLALAASPAESVSRYYDQDIYILDRQTGSTRPVVRLEGIDSQPTWSPGGKWIAFATQRGQGSRGWLQLLGMYEVETGTIRYPAHDQFEAGLGTPRDFAWASDSQLFFISDHRLHAPIFELDVRSTRVRRASALDRSYLSNLTIAPDANTLLFGCESFDRPRDLCSSSTTQFTKQRLTDLNPNLALPASDLRIVSWRSEDDRWDLEGILITPQAGSGPFPLITLIEGGPSMVRVQYGVSWPYPVHAFVASGYAVFVPNTRGRGGYSAAFRQALPESRDFVAAPFHDVMTGIDKLVREGVVDSNRLGIAGFSYGGLLTAYSITQTDRFDAASINDSPVNFPYTMSLGAASPVMQEHWQHQAGFSDPYDPHQLALMRAQSPITHISAAKTPSLLEYGQRDFGGVGEMSGGELFHGLRRFSVPSEFILYPRTGHGIYEPRLRKESARRNVEWFDYWMLGRATERMKQQYGPAATLGKRTAGDRRPVLMTDERD